MLPIPSSDDHPTRFLPVLTGIIIALTVLTSLAVYLPDLGDRADAIFVQHGFIPDLPAPATFLTSIWLHAGLFHLAVNMWFLAVFGDDIEDWLGGGALILYLASGIAGNLVHMWCATGADRLTPLIGASGAVSGMLGAYMVAFPVATLRFRYGSTNAECPAVIYCGLWFLAQLLLSASAQDGRHRIAYGAHVGGFLFGAAAALLVKRVHPPDRPAWPAPVD